MSFLLSAARRFAALPTISKRTFSSSPSSQLARMTLIGRLGADAEVVPIKGGTSEVLKYSVGTSFGPKDNRQTSWFRVTCFAGSSEALRSYVLGLQKGTLVYVEGDANMNSYDDKDGNRQTNLNLVQTKLEVLKRPNPIEAEAT